MYDYLVPPAYLGSYENKKELLFLLFDTSHSAVISKTRAYRRAAAAGA